MTTADPIRLLLIGAPGTEFRTAAVMARDAGAEVAMADTVADALALLRDRNAGLVMIDVLLDVAALIAQLRAERLAVPVLACGIDAPAARAVAAIHAGACDYLPLPPQAELIAAAIALAAPPSEVPTTRIPQGADATGRTVEALVGRTVEDVERELILQTLQRCHGNRTSASTILGISVRTMRNKLKSFIEAGIPVAPAL